MIRCHLAAGTLLAMIFWVATGAAHADEPADKPVDGRRQFTFSWAFRDGDEMAPRGGISSGADLSLVGEPTKAWQALQEEDLTPWERDRRAILAMAGDAERLMAQGFDDAHPKPIQPAGLLATVAAQRRSASPMTTDRRQPALH